MPEDAIASGTPPAMVRTRLVQGNEALPRAPSPPTWMLEESTWEPARNQAWESLCTVANGYVGVRGFPEEEFDAGPTRPGIYIAGVFNPNPNGIPELVNVTNFLAVEILLDDVRFHL
jgi:trehalose/maltose hydrolase-like predicted phosphorylase